MVVQCPYCGMPFSDVGDASEHLKSCPARPEPNEAVKEEEYVTAKEEETEPVDLEKLTVEKLKAFAAENAVDIVGLKTKTDLITAIEAAKSGGSDGLAE